MLEQVRDILKPRHQPVIDFQATSNPEPEPLITGMRMNRDEFIRRWEALPDLKRAELIEGIVFVPSPLGYRHGDFDGRMHAWLGLYALSTAGVDFVVSPTTYMLESAPQPDGCLRIRKSGSTEVAQGFLRGAPELIVEVCDSSVSYDFGPKLDLYQRAGVKEYITLDTTRRRFIWRELVYGKYQEVEPQSKGILKSIAFPGLWLDPRHVWSEDGPAMLALLQEGLGSPEHAAFVELLRGA